MPDKLIQTALDQFREAETLTQEWRRDAQEDLEFAHGDQWPAELKAWRISQRLPTLTIDRLEGPISQLVGDQRQNDLAVKITCKSLESAKLRSTEGKEIEEQEFLAGVVRDVQRRSRFEWIQAQAFEHAVTCGLGGWYVETEYENPRSFDQTLVIRRVPNPLSIYPDAINWASTQGMDYCFILDHLPADQFKRQYPKACTAFEGGDEWGGDMVRVAIWWQRVFTDDTLLQLRDSEGRLSHAYKSSLKDMPLPRGTNVIRERPTQRARVMRRLITSLEVLEETEWVGRYVPVALVTGKETWLKGKLDWMGMVRKAKDPQRLYNYNRSTVAEIMGGAPRAPWILTPEQIAGYEGMWATANVGNKPYLLANADPKAPGWPHRVQLDYPAGFQQEAIIAAADIMSTTKIHEASLGQRSNETSGVAIQARQSEGDTGNYVFTDQLLLAIEETGRILVDAVPKVYDATRAVQSRARDGTVTTVQLNQPRPDGISNRLSGDYEVEVTSGPAFGTARQESVQAMTALAQAAPQLLQVGADIWIGNMDWPGADELAARLKKMVPQELLSDEEKEGDPALQVAQMQQAIQQMQQIIQEGAKRLQEAEEAVQQAQADTVTTQGEIERLKTDLNTAQSELRLSKQAAQIKLDAMQAEARIKADFDEAANTLRGMINPAHNEGEQDAS